MSRCMNRSLMGIVLTPPPSRFILIFTIFEHKYLTSFYDNYKPPLNEVHIMLSKALMFHKNIELLPSGDCYDLSLNNNYPTEHTTLVLVCRPVINQLEWFEVANPDLL